MSRYGRRGFTKIEAAVVTVILGILAAFAVPRYRGLQNEARIAALDSMAGSVRSAANMAHGVWLVDGNVSPILVDGKRVNIVNGYPDAAGLLDLIEDTSGFTTEVLATAGTVTFTPSGAPAATAATCNVVYSQATDGASFTLTVQTATQQSSC